MKITQEAQGLVSIVRLAGQLMGGPDADAVRETILALLKDGKRSVVLDLKDVTWVNSTGLGVLIRTHLEVTSQGGDLKLMQISKRIEDIFTVTRLNTVFRIYETEASAIASFAG